MAQTNCNSFMFQQKYSAPTIVLVDSVNLVPLRISLEIFNEHHEVMTFRLYTSIVLIRQHSHRAMGRGTCTELQSRTFAIMHT